MVAEEKKRLQITLSRETIEELEKQAVLHGGVSKSALASIAITEWLNKKKEQQQQQ